MFTALRCVVLALVLLACAPAHAIVCAPGVAHFIDVGTGPNCNTEDIQTAIDSIVCSDTSIRISTANGETYIGQHIALNNVSTAIIGNVEECKPQPVVCDPNIGCNGGPRPKVAIGGDGANPVFYVNGGGAVSFVDLSISGGKGADNMLSGGGGIGIFGNATAVTLRNVELANNTGGNGGGVAFYGDGSLTLDGAYIHDNTAGYGGGVSAYSSYVGHIELAILDDPLLPTNIYNNRGLYGGGGIYTGGATHLRAVAAAAGRISIQGNHAGDPIQNIGGNGGGLYLSGTAFADIALPGLGIVGNDSNSAGGGIFVGASTSGTAGLRLFSTDAQNPTLLYFNSAVAGGGLFLNGGNASVHATACVFDGNISSNTSTQNGSALYVGDMARLLVNPDVDSECNFGTVAALGAVHCDPDVYECNRMATNNVSSYGSALYFTGAAQIEARRLRVEDNNSAYALLGQYASGAASIAFHECLFAGNDTDAELVYLDGAHATFDGCTFADNTIGGGQVFAFDTGLDLTRSIVRESTSLRTYDPDHAQGLVAQYLILNGPKLPTDGTVLYADPQFIDAANGDYRLQSSSPAVDFAPTGNEADVFDLDGSSREADLPGVTNRFGPRDLGAYEYPLPDRIFRNGFEVPG